MNTRLSYFHQFTFLRCRSFTADQEEVLFTGREIYAPQVKKAKLALPVV